MSQVNNVIDNLSHNTSLIKEIAGKMVNSGKLETNPFI